MSNDSEQDDRDVVVTQDLGDGWEAVMTWPGDEPIQGGPSSLLVRPTNPQDVPFGGIATPLFRNLDFKAAAAAARRIGRGESKYGAKRARLAEPVDHPRMLRNELTHNGLSDRALVLVSMWYLRLVGEGVARPVQVIAEQLDRSDVTVRGWLTMARRKNFLKGSPGKLGGRMTKEAERVLLDENPAS